MPIQQSGNITPGHVAVWTTDGVIQDGGAVAAASTILGSLRGANFNTLLDQPIQIFPTIAAFQITGILVTNASIPLSGAAGGFYPTANKGGTAIVASGQVYSSLTTASKLLAATLAGTVATTRYSALNMDAVFGFLTLYLSLTTPQGSPATADVFILGNNLT